MPHSEAVIVAQPKELPSLHIEVISGKWAVRDALEQLKSGLGPLALDPDEMGTIELVLAEAMNNIVEHAYPPGAPQGPIALHCQAHPAGIAFLIEDRGRPMPDGQLPMGKPVDLGVDFGDMPEGGFGWFLIKDLAKDVEYQRLGSTNRLRFRMTLAG